MKAFLRLFAAQERLDKGPVLVFVAVFGSLVANKGHESLFGVLLLDQIFPLSTFDVPAEKQLSTGIERIHLQQVLGAEQLRTEAQTRTDITP